MQNDIVDKDAMSEETNVILKRLVQYTLYTSLDTKC